MFLETIATLLAGVGAAGVVLLLNRLLRGRLPKWVMPVAAGAAMIAVTILNEYSWFPRTRASLPEGLSIIDTVENRSFYRPWTYAVPFVERFVAVDTVSLRAHEGQPGQTLGDVYLFGRWAPVHKLPVLADCAGGRRAALTDAVSFAGDGSVQGAEWAKVPADDPIVAAMCGGW